MSRSRKKPWEWITKPWDKYKESRLRGRVKRACRRAEIEQDFDPDRDWEELQATNKKVGEYGTRCGYEVPPDPDSSNFQDFLKAQRK